MEKKKLIIIVVIVSAVLCLIFLPGFSELHKLRAEIEQYRKRINFLEGHNERLKTELSRLRHDPSYVEEKARDKLGIIKKGEIIYKSKTKNKTPKTKSN